jgi:hypothetical protein
VSALVAAGKWLVRVCRRWRARSASAREAAYTHVDFYEDFLELMARHGITRDRRQTQREFAEQVAQALAQPLAGSGLAGLPHTIVEAFYRVRFGAETLTPAELIELRGLLARLQACLDSPATVAV